MKKSILLISSFVTLIISTTNAQNDDFVRSPLVPSVENQKNISYCIEVFSIPLVEAASLQRSRLSSKQLYDKLIEGLATEKTKQLNFITLKSRSGEIVTSEAIVEKIYPTSFPLSDEKIEENNLAASEEEQSNTPSNFETRNTGTIIECESNLSTDNKTVDISFKIEAVGLTGQSIYGKGSTEQQHPQFETRRVLSNVTTVVDRPTLLYTLNYSPFIELDKEAKDNVYFLFITTTIDQP